jgi:protein TonB
MRPALSLAVVAVVHVGLFYALMSGSHRGIKTEPPPPLMIRIIKEAKPQQAPALLAQPRVVVPPPPFVPPPEIRVRGPAVPNAITTVPTEAPVAPKPIGQTKGDGQAEGKADQGHVAPRMVSEEACRPIYPPASRRLGQKGTTRVLVLVDVDGKVVQSKIAQSSGHPWLDDAALAAMSACGFVPGTVDGKPERAWHIVPYTFSLEQGLR